MNEVSITWKGKDIKPKDNSKVLAYIGYDDFVECIYKNNKFKERNPTIDVGHDITIRNVEDPVTIHQSNMMRDDITDMVMCWVYINDLKPNL
jgi:hypothetical protein